MKTSLITYIETNNIKLAANAKAKKLIDRRASEVEIAVAIATTKAYKEDETLRQLCIDIIDAAGKPKVEEPVRSTSRRGGERTYLLKLLNMEIEIYLHITFLIFDIMTKWQESCIKALASSPLAWEAFKLKQKNKKLLWQYVNRIWPYHVEKNYSADYTNFRDFLLKLLAIIKLGINATDLSEYIPYRTISTTISLKTFSSLVTSKDFLSTCGGIYKDSARQQALQNNGNSLMTVNIMGKSYNCNGNGLLMEIFILATWDIKYCGYFLNGITSITIVFSPYVTDTLIKLKYLQEECIALLNLIEKQATKKAVKQYNWLNIGIEIEHDANKLTSKGIQYKILQNNCKEYDSGFDGNSSNRLRENRIRLNGLPGLKGLYILLQDMQTKCAIATNSSVHMHIDCKYDNSFLKMRGILSSNEIHFKIKDCNSLLCKLFRIPSNINNILDTSTPLLLKSDFETVEYRFCIPNFCYSDYVIQILALIHITECLKHKCPVNKQYLEMLYKIMCEINKDIIDGRKLPAVINASSVRSIETFRFASASETQMTFVRN